VSSVRRRFVGVREEEPEEEDLLDVPDMVWGGEVVPLCC
jgi:hypothetical protein